MREATRATFRPRPRLRNQTAVRAAKRIASLACLTASERAVLLWYIIIPDNKTLALALNRRPNTIRNQLASAVRKLKVETRGGLMIFLYTGEKLWLGENDYGNRRRKR